MCQFVLYWVRRDSKFNEFMIKVYIVIILWLMFISYFSFMEACELLIIFSPYQ